MRSIAHQLLTGLAQLHDAHRVVHRDMKPSNVLLQQPFLVQHGKVTGAFPAALCCNTLSWHCFIWSFMFASCFVAVLKCRLVV